MRARRDTCPGVKGPASKPKLSEALFSVLEQELAEGPVAHGWPDQTWTLARIKTLIGRGFHKSMALSKGVLRDHGPGARLGEVRVRTLSRLGFDVRVGIGPSITVAATAASAPVPEPGGAVVGRRPL